MKQFILLKTFSENYPFIVDVLKMLLGNSIEIRPQQEALVIYTGTYDKQEVTDTIRSLEADLNTSIMLYLSSTNNPELEQELVMDLFLKASYNFYDLKSLIMETNNLPRTEEILNLILEGTGVSLPVIQAMADCDLNASKASHLLYMHRNTLLYKMERLLELSGFDLKSFYDVYLLIKLMKA